MLDKIKSFVYKYKVQLLSVAALISAFTLLTDTKLDDSVASKLPAIIEMLAPDDATPTAE